MRSAVFRMYDAERRRDQNLPDTDNSGMRQLRYQRSDLLCGVRAQDEDALPVDTMTAIRMNVDDFDEAYQMLISRGFKNYCGDQAVSTKTSKSAIMISPTGFVINLIHHIKK